MHKRILDFNVRAERIIYIGRTLGRILYLYSRDLYSHVTVYNFFKYRATDRVESRDLVKMGILISAT